MQTAADDLGAARAACRPHGAYLTAASIGVGLGAWLAPFFYYRSMWANGLACMVLKLGALLALGRVRVG
jgi:hypothetical protein